MWRCRTILANSEPFALPPFPAALDEWFMLATDLGGDSELIHDGAILDGLGVVDAETARQALIGYRFVLDEGGGWMLRKAAFGT